MINHRPAPGFEDEAPYAIAVVELEEGVRMMTNLVGVPNTPEHWSSIWSSRWCSSGAGTSACRCSSRQEAPR
ncbi:Zn-ribbon domain-containing OB-fold protein [Nonomuraea rubra]|uniref:Zn-ribbon domain-containing OB-fold protein n=1 Tax=Nonomuraea rubra TaxID=46180 RepID=UPI003CD070EC